MAHEHEPSPADADDEDNPYDVAYLAEDNCDTDSEDKVEYPDEDEEEEDDWGGVILDLAAALTGPEGKEWWAAMKEEMESLDEQGTWTLADLPEVAMDLDLLQLDVKNAFLHSTINHEIYMQQSPYFTDGRSNVCLLQKSLYGLKQTPLQWYKELDKGAGPFMGADGRLVGLKRVLLVPGLCANLLSTKALSEAGMQKEMMGTKVFKATLDGRVLWDLRGGKDMHRSMWEIPVLPWKEAAARLAAEAIRGGHASHITSGGGGDGSDGGLLVHGGGALPSVTPSTGETDWLTAHRRFGHVALPQLQQLFKEERVKGLRIKGEPKEVGSCETCLTSKFSRFPFHSTVGQSSDPVELVHVDLMGPMKVKGDGGALYSMTMVDDYTRLTWSFPLAKKSDAARVIIEGWLPMVERESGKRVKAIRSDRGGEFLGAEFRSWLKRHGIKQQLITAYTPQSNGVAERANRTIIEGGRTILVDSDLPLRFWPLAIRHATVIKNRVLTHVGGQHWVPMEKWSGKKPLVDMLRVFGCMGLVHVPKEKRDKLEAAAFMEGLMFKEWSERGRSKVTIPLGIEVGTNDPLLIPIELSSSSELTEVSHDLGGAEGEAADVEEVLQQGEAPIAERGDTEEEVHQPTPSPKLPSRRTTQGKRDAVCGGAKEGAAKERPKRAAHPRDFLKYERLGVPKALLVQEEEYEEEKGAEGEMEQICCFGVNLPHEPASMEEALAGDDREAWLASREDDFQSHMENETWTLTNLSPGRKALECMWVLRVKTDVEGRLERRKRRLVIKGFQQREGIDFQEVFVPVAKAPTLRLLLAAAAVCGWKVEQMDVKTAFFYGVVDEEIYMKQPEGYDDGSGRVCRLNKAIYSLKQAPRLLGVGKFVNITVDPPIDPLLPQGPAPSGVSQVDPLPGTVPVEVAFGSGAPLGAASGGAESGGAEPGGAEPRGAEPGGAESEGARSGGAEPGGEESEGAGSGGAEPLGAEPRGAEPAGVEPGGTTSRGAEPRGTASPGGPAGAPPRLSPRPEPLSS
ncbi:unnamed protein product [Closterium sp. NIES-53]